MDVEALASLESQMHFCKELIDKVLKQECFILLSGESGSGRTVACEHVVNETDSKMRAVFIPCSPDMQLHQLRGMFLSQLLPNAKFDDKLNLADAVSNVQIPQDQKVLIVVDDIDKVVVSFYNELLALYEEFFGQSRFAFILVCHPMWAEEKIRSYMGKAHLQQMQIPPLSTAESIVLSRHTFAQQDTLRIYNAVASYLPAALAPAKGNISQIIKITEKLMKEPTAATGTDLSHNQKANAPAAKKKSSSVGIFVSVVCIVIVLACLVPILMGGNFFSSSTSDTTVVKGANEGGLAFDEKQYVVDDGVLPSKVPTGLDAPTADASTEHSVTLSGEELDKIEGGVQSSAYPRGVDGSVNPNQAVSAEPFKHANSQQGDNNAAAAAAAAMGLVEEDLPADLAAPNTPATANTPANAANQLTVLKRERNLNHAPSVPSFVNNPQPNEALLTPPDISAEAAKANAQAKVQAAEEERAKLEAAAKAKLEADRKLAAQAKLKEEQEQAKAQQALQAQKAQEQTATRPAQPSRPPLRAGQIINLADEQRQMEAQRRPAQHNAASRPVPSGNAFEGQVTEISNIANTHYTVQIVSASNRANISAAAQGLNGKYWILETRRNGRPWYVLCAGDYASRNEAMQAAANIPRSVSQGASPFAKSIADLKAEFRL